MKHTRLEKVQHRLFVVVLFCFFFLTSSATVDSFLVRWCSLKLRCYFASPRAKFVHKLTLLVNEIKYLKIQK